MSLFLQQQSNRATAISVWINGWQLLHLPRTLMCVWAHGHYLPTTVKNVKCMCKSYETFFFFNQNIFCTPISSLPPLFPSPWSVRLLTMWRVCVMCMFE